MNRIMSRLAARELTQSELRDVSGAASRTYYDTDCTTGPDAEGITITITNDDRQGYDWEL